MTEGEWHLLKFLNESLKRDELFQAGDLSKYKGWLIFVQPYLNGSRPDIIIFHPYIGVQIFEVKDWNLNNYSFENKRSGDKSSVTFCFKDSRGVFSKKSPIKQVEYYKEKIAGQLLPQIGESFDRNSQQYGLIKTAVYFHKASTAQAQELFNSQIKDFSKFPVIGCDALLKSNLTKVVPDSYLSQSIYWQKDWNKELLFWLYPPFHAIEQGTPLELKADQKKFAEPQTGHYRVRGVAGSGKTQVLAYRAAKLASQGYHVLVLTFNLTLGHLIHDMVSKSPFAFEWNKLTITYFHGFCKDILNEYGEEWPRNDADEESLFREVVPNKILEIISRNEYKRHDTILIDEGQDFCIEWYSMLCHFLTGRDEVVVVCDKKQNIYKRQMEWLDKRRRGVEKFGDWIELKKIIRLPEQIAKVCVDFSEEFKLNQDIRILEVEKPDLFNQFDDHVVWWNIGNNWLDKVDEAFEIIKSLATHKHPSDTVILLPFKKWGVNVYVILRLKNTSMQTMYLKKMTMKNTIVTKKRFGWEIAD